MPQPCHARHPRPAAIPGHPRPHPVARPHPQHPCVFPHPGRRRQEGREPLAHPTRPGPVVRRPTPGRHFRPPWSPPVHVASLAASPRIFPPRETDTGGEGAAIGPYTSPHPTMPGRRRPSPSTWPPPRFRRVSHHPGRRRKGGRRHDRTPATASTSHTRRLPLTRTKPTAEDVPRPCGCPRGFPTCHHTPGG